METSAAVIDPTKNVLDTVAAESRLTDSKISGLYREIEGLRRELKTSEAHAGELRKTDLERLDALREVDRLEARDRDRATQTAVETLAKSNSATAETLRANQIQTASGIATQLESYKKDTESRLSLVERFQSAGTGKGVGMNALWGYILAALMAAITLYKTFGGGH